MIRIIILLTFLTLATARPGFKNIFDRVQHKKAFDHAMKKRTDEGACVTTATVVGKLLENVRYLFRPSVQDDFLHGFINQMAGFDVFDHEQRERVVCGLADLGSLSELLAAEKELGLDYQAVKDLYNYAVLTLRFSRYHLELLLNDPNIAHWYDEDFVKRREELLELNIALEISGVLALDPKGFELVKNLLDLVRTDHIVITSLEVSDAPTDAKCNRIATDFRKVWNGEIAVISQWDPNAGQEMIDRIRQWTGLDIGNHGNVRSIVCDLLENALNDGVRGIYEWLEGKGVLHSLTRTGYPHLVAQLQQLKAMLDMYYGSQHYTDAYPSQHSHYGPSEQESELQSLGLQALEGIESMGLLSLTNDL